MSFITSIQTGGSNNHQTTSEEANGLATDFVGAGIVGTVGNTSAVAPMTGGFAINASSGMNLTVGTGVAWLAATPTSQNSQTFRVKNNASYTLAISSNASGSTKYDFVYLKLDPTNLNTPNSAGDNAASIVTSRSSNSNTDDGGSTPTYGLLLAVVTVANGAVSIANASISDRRSQVALTTGASNASDGWRALSNTVLSVSSGYNKGNKEFLVNTSTDLSGIISKGNRLKLSRGTTPPSQCADLESSSSQYASKTSPAGLTFTDNYTLEAWVKLESYTLGGIVARRNADIEGWSLGVNGLGQVIIESLRIASNNRVATSYQSLPLDTWVHVAATVNLAGSAIAIYINGVSVPNSVSTTGTITALVQGTTALVIGARKSGGTDPFDGKISEVRIHNVVKTATEIRDNMNQQITPAASCVGYFKLNGDFNDASTNANNATGVNSAVATSVDNPMNATEYFIINEVTSSTMTLFGGTDNNVPNLTLNSPYYSFQKVPYGFDATRNKWRVEYLALVDNTGVGIVSVNNWAQSANTMLSIPKGNWNYGYRGVVGLASSVSGSRNGNITMAPSTPTASTFYTKTTAMILSDASSTSIYRETAKESDVILTAQTPYYMYGTIVTSTGSESFGFLNSRSPFSMYADSAWV